MQLYEPSDENLDGKKIHRNSTKKISSTPKFGSWCWTPEGRPSSSDELNTKSLHYFRNGGNPKGSEQGWTLLRARACRPQREGEKRRNASSSELHYWCGWWTVYSVIKLDRGVQEEEDVGKEGVVVVGEHYL